MTPISTPKPFNRTGYIATLRATKIREEDGLSIMIYLAEKCADDRTLRKRTFTAEKISQATGISRITAVRRIRKLKTNRLLLNAKMKRVSHYQLPAEMELQRFV